MINLKSKKQNVPKKRKPKAKKTKYHKPDLTIDITPKNLARFESIEKPTITFRRYPAIVNWTDEIDDYLVELDCFLNVKEISVLLGISEVAVGKRLNEIYNQVDVDDTPIVKISEEIVYEPLIREFVVGKIYKVLHKGSMAEMKDYTGKCISCSGDIVTLQKEKYKESYRVNDPDYDFVEM